ncbi:MAG: hypothetical protein KatS3mg124_0037 [Porticoccaceae bacterium]|nr:MAG: hypothetical protein KatS3mg124_0037 [Porticoccaceae bacterium]
MRELLEQMGALHGAAAELLADPASTILDIDRRVTAKLRAEDFPRAQFGYPLAGSLLPWIDSALPSGQSREEWKAQAEANKILGREADPVPIDGTCVRVGAMRSHSQALTVKLTADVPLDELEQRIAAANPWVEVVPNEREATLARLTPRRGERQSAHRRGAAAQVGHGRALPERLHRRRSAPLGSRRAAAAHVADPARILKRARLPRAAGWEILAPVRRPKGRAGKGRDGITHR